MIDEDVTCHARSRNLSILRYANAGKWVVSHRYARDCPPIIGPAELGIRANGNGRAVVTVGQAAALASALDMEIYPDLKGGRRFERLYRNQQRNERVQPTEHEAGR